MDTHRLLFIGAGFSKLAGLPLGNELFHEVRNEVAKKHGKDNALEHDLSRYIKYIKDCEGRILTPETLNYEEFIGFLDIEHYLGLKGSDTDTSEGNASQLTIRKAIGKVLLERTPNNKDIPVAYHRFAQQLTTSDWVLTFNYDTLLEQVLELEGIPYRLVPYRFSEINILFNTIDRSHPKELVLLKLHGSIDWFSRSSYEESVEVRDATFDYDVKHQIFGFDKIVEPIPLAEGLCPFDDPLKTIYRVNQGDLKILYDQPYLQSPPFILAPSNTKIFYVKPLQEFWWGMQNAGGLNLSVGIIGYSLPSYDSYARQSLYQVVKNFTDFEPDFSLEGRSKSKLRILNYCQNEEDEEELRRQYRFVNWDRTELWLDGFNEDGADWILR